MAEKWSGQNLSPKCKMYGIRRYLRGARMMLHVDKLPWNIIGAILHVNTYYTYIYKIQTILISQALTSEKSELLINMYLYKLKIKKLRKRHEIPEVKFVC